MATAPSFISSQQTALNATSPKDVGASLTALINDILVEVSGVGDSFDSLGTPTGGTGVTRTQRAIEDAGSNTRAEARLWTSPIPSNQTFTPSFNRPSGINDFIGTALLIRGSDGFDAASSSNNGTGSGAPSWTLTTTTNNCLIVAVVVDWNAVDGASRTWRTVNGITPTAGNGFERSYVLSGTGALTYYVAYWPDVGAAGAKTLGLSTPNTMRWVGCSVSLKGAAGIPNKLIGINQTVKRAAFW